MAKITVKRMVPLVTIVTESFKKGVSDSTLIEIKNIDNQINEVQNHIKQLQGRFGMFSTDSTKASQGQVNATVAELNGRIERLKNIKSGLMATYDDVKNKPIGSEVQTGTIESFVELDKGDNIRKILERAKIVVKDDIIQEIVV